MMHVLWLIYSLSRESSYERAKEDVGGCSNDKIAALWKKVWGILQHYVTSMIINPSPLS